MEPASQQAVEKQARAHRALLWLGLAVIVASAMVAALLIGVGPAGLIDTLERFTAWIRANALLALFVLALWSFVSQLAAVPSGTLTMLAGGFLLSWPSAFAYFVAMVAAGQIVHAGARDGLNEGAQRWIGRLHERWPRADIAAWSQAARKEGIVVTAALRSLPFLPSAGGALVAGGLGVTSRDFLLGTLLAGWVRPLAFSLIGASLSALTIAREPIDLTATGAGIAVLAFAAAAPALAAARCFRRLKD